MASYSLNDRAVARARRLIDARQYVLDSDWGDVQPRADAENAYLESHSWEEYAEWHLGLTDGAAEETKARYGFVYGDFRRVHRTGLIACVYRAAEWRHKEVLQPYLHWTQDGTTTRGRTKVLTRLAARRRRDHRPRTSSATGRSTAGPSDSSHTSAR